MAVSSDERFTPAYVLDVVRAHAPIALDPCTPAENPTRARVFYTVKEDGLARPWTVKGLVYVNPPFSRGELLRWALKATQEAALDPDREIIMLTPCDLGTRWAQVLFEQGQSIAFWRGRIAFGTPDGEYEAGAKQPSALWYLGERAARFERVFQTVANVVHLGARRSRSLSVPLAEVG